MNAITVKDLTKKYREVPAVSEISFEVKAGEFFALLGENGVGKSTTIQMLCTILKKTAGEVEIFGRALGREDDEIRKNIGIVFQNSVLDGKLTVKENLYTRGSYYGFDSDGILKRLKPVWDRLDLGEIWDRKYEKLSGGQRRRVDIIRALIHEPKILFLDEPTTGLDPLSRKLVWDYINSLRKEKKMTIFLTTHYMEEVRDADQVVILDRGKIIADDTPAGLKNRYACRKLIWYAADSAENRDLLGTLESEYDVDHFTVRIPKEYDLTEFIYGSRSRIRDYEVLKGSMDDVFMHLTGRRMEG